MSLAPPELPEDSTVVVLEVAAHLRELADRRVADRHDLASVWLSVQLCDEAVLDALDPEARQRYQSVVAVLPRRRPPARGWACRPGLGTDAAHLRVALHRRLVILRGLRP